jgi:hypothetical protein
VRKYSRHREDARHYATGKEDITTTRFMKTYYSNKCTDVGDGIMSDGFMKSPRCRYRRNKFRTTFVTYVLDFSNGFHNCLACKIYNMRETAVADINYENHTCAQCHVPNMSLDLIKGYTTCPKDNFEMEHKRIIIAGIIDSHPPDLTPVESVYNLNRPTTYL